MKENATVLQINTDGPVTTFFSLFPSPSTIFLFSSLSGLLDQTCVEFRVLRFRALRAFRALCRELLHFALS